ncbi:MAG: hypothetical protein FGM54_07285 [Chitinophagaceae bacterium]|nr:hypothetical protein [Chitinophagaceae bacterium]
MNNTWTWIKKQRASFIGVLVGAMAGYAYYYYIGCASGTCAITSSPINSTAYGALMGYLTVGSFPVFQKNKS